MDNTVFDNIRVQSLTLENTRNVRRGEIVVHRGPMSLDDPGVIAIYGQNGSGKTTVVDAFSIVQHLMMGDALPSETDAIITLGEPSARLLFKFVVEGPLGGAGQERPQWEVSYELTLARSPERKVYVSEERVRGKQILPKTANERPIDWFGCKDAPSRCPVMPERLWHDLDVKQQNAVDELRARKAIAVHEGKSFLFSPYFADVLRRCEGHQTEISILHALRRYAMTSLFVVNKLHTGLIYTKLVLPLSFRVEQDGPGGRAGSAGTQLLTLEERDSLPKIWFHILEQVLSELNVILDALIPGLSVKARVLTEQFSQNNEHLTVFELVSVREGKEMPLRFESNGVRRLVSVLSLLMAVYEKPYVCVVIDELDAGIFELVLGQLIDMLSQSGQGQLIFTSHNMRALEVLRPRQIVVTTADPYRRFTTLKNIKPTNNTRNKYYELLEHSNLYYTGQDRLRIEQAFQRAGDTWEQVGRQSSC